MCVCACTRAWFIVAFIKSSKWPPTTDDLIAVTEPVPYSIISQLSPYSTGMLPICRSLIHWLIIILTVIQLLLSENACYKEPKEWCSNQLPVWSTKRWWEKNNGQTSAQHPHELAITNETSSLSVISPHLWEKELLKLLVNNKLRNTNSYRTNCFPFQESNNFPLSFKMCSSLVWP